MRCAARIPQDGRGQVLQITEAGTDLIKRMWNVYRRTIAANFARKLEGRGREIGEAVEPAVVDQEAL